MLISASSQRGHTCVFFFPTPTNKCRRSRLNLIFVLGQARMFERVFTKERKRHFLAGTQSGNQTKMRFSSFTQADNLLTLPLWLISCVTHTHALAQQRLIHKCPNANDNPFVSVFSTRFYPEIPFAVVCSIPLFNPVRLFPLGRLPCLLCLYFNFSAVLPRRYHATVVLSCCLSSAHSRRGRFPPITRRDAGKKKRRLCPRSFFFFIYK